MPPKCRISAVSLSADARPSLHVLAAPLRRFSSGGRDIAHPPCAPHTILSLPSGRARSVLGQPRTATGVIWRLRQRGQSYSSAIIRLLTVRAAAVAASAPSPPSPRSDTITLGSHTGTRTVSSAPTFARHAHKSPSSGPPRHAGSMPLASPHIRLSPHATFRRRRSPWTHTSWVARARGAHAPQQRRRHTLHGRPQRAGGAHAAAVATATSHRLLRRE